MTDSLPLAELAKRIDDSSLTLREVARRCTDAGTRMHYTEVSRYLRGERMPTLPKFAALCDLVAVPNRERAAMLDRIAGRTA